MSALERIAFFQNRRDEVPNLELAKTLAETKDHQGIREIAENLWSKDKNIQSDCLKVLYEIGYTEPGLVADYAGDFLKLLKNKNNRLVWGGMIALGTVAQLKADALFPRWEEVRDSMEAGSVITKDNGVKVLAAIAAQKEQYSQAIFPYLLHHLKTCRPKEVPQHAEKILVAVNKANKSDFLHVLDERTPGLKPSEITRIQRILRQLEKI